MTYGGRDWHYIVDDNFSTVRIYLDLPQITNEKGFINQVGGNDDANSEDMANNRNTFIDSLRMSVAQLSTRFMRTRMRNQDQELSYKEHQQQIFQSIDENHKNFTDVMMARTNA